VVVITDDSHLVVITDDPHSLVLSYNRKIQPVRHRDVAQCGEIDVLNTGDIESILIRSLATLVMCVDTACGTKVMLGDLSVPLVKAQLIFTPGDCQFRQPSGGHRRSFLATQGTVAAPQPMQALGGIHLKLYSAAMAATY